MHRTRGARAVCDPANRDIADAKPLASDPIARSTCFDSLAKIAVVGPVHFAPVL